MRKVEIKKGNLTLKDETICFLEKTVTPYGTGAKVDALKEYIGYPAYVIICKKRAKK
jgi:putative transposon-encoded protein